MKHFIIKRVPAYRADFSWEFEGDIFNANSGDYCNTMFIIDKQYRNGIWENHGFNSDEYDIVTQKVEDLLEYAEEIRDNIEGRKYQDYKQLMQSYGIENVRSLGFSVWAQSAHADDFGDFASVAQYLTFQTGKQWDYMNVYGCVQGAIVCVVYCTENYDEKVALREGEIWLGCAEEFRVVELDDDGREIDAGYTEFVSMSEDCWDDDKCKQLICGWIGIDIDDARFEDEQDDSEDGDGPVDLVLSSAELSFEISDSKLSLNRIIAEVERKYPGWHFNRTESRHESCIMAVFEKW